MKTLKEMSLKELLESLLLSDNVSQGTKDIIRASLVELLEAEAAARQKVESAKEGLPPVKLDYSNGCKINLNGNIYDIGDVESIFWEDEDGEEMTYAMEEDEETGELTFPTEVDLDSFYAAEKWEVVTSDGEVYAVLRDELDGQTENYLLEFVQTM